MNLDILYTCMDDNTPEQKYFDLVFLFEDNDKVYDYTMSFHSGMHIDDFKEYFKLVAEAMQKTGPTLCTT